MCLGVSGCVSYARLPWSLLPRVDSSVLPAPRPAFRTRQWPGDCQSSTCPAPCPLSDGPPWVGHWSLGPSWWTCGLSPASSCRGCCFNGLSRIYGFLEFRRFYRFPSAGIAPFGMTPEMEKTPFFFKAWSGSFCIFRSPIGKKWYLSVVLTCVSVTSKANRPFLCLWLVYLLISFQKVFIE